MKKKKEFRLMDQIALDQTNQQDRKTLEVAQVQDFTPEEIENYNKYNENIYNLDSEYTSLQPLNRDVILRLMVKDFTRKRDDVLVYSKNDLIPVRSGVNGEIIYLNVPSPYPFTKKAVVVAVPNENFHVQPGDVVALREKLQIGFESQDKGFVSIQGGFVHPDFEEDYDNVPEDPQDKHFGYVLLNENAINLKLK